MQTRVNRSRLKQKLGFRLRLAERATYRDFLAEVGITPVQYSLLALVADNEGLSQGVLGLALNLDRATTMAIMNKLEHAGWIERRRSSQDRRRYAMFLTPKGDKQIKELEVLVCSSDDGFKQRLSDAELEQLVMLLEKIYSDSQ